MTLPPACPHCGEPLERVVDLPYGYWSFEDGRYVLRASAPGVVVPEFACARCLRGLEGFHPEDVRARAAS
jgi:hypothetical protein